jgi:hypothetical protein
MPIYYVNDIRLIGKRDWITNAKPLAATDFKVISGEVDLTNEFDINYDAENLMYTASKGKVKINWPIKKLDSYDDVMMNTDTFVFSRKMAAT